MTEDVGRSWKPVARSDADVDLLQRSINHVENLLHRLEYSAVPASQGADSASGTDSADGAGGADSGEGAGITTVAVEAEATARTRTDRPSAVADPSPQAAQADALRITLEAHQEASQIRAQAAAVHAKAVAESERLLVEAQHVCEQLRAGAISAAAAKADDLRTAAQAQADVFERDARKRVDSAIVEVAAEADAVRVLVHDTFCDVVAMLSDALACLQQLTTAIGPEAPLAIALAKRQRLHAAAEDLGAGERSSTDTPGAFPAEVSSADGTAGSAGAPITRGVAGGPIFRIARR